MNYRSKRINAGLGTYTMAKELGVDEEKYKNLERGELELKGQLLDKFMNTINRAKEIRFNRKDRIHELDEWVNSGQAEKDIKATGYNQTEIGKFIGVSNSNISHLIRDKKGSDDLKEKLYDFVTNPLNKKVEDNKKDNKTENKKKDKKVKVDKKVTENTEKIAKQVIKETLQEEKPKIEEKCEDTCECACVDIDKNKYIDELKEEIFNLKKENMYLKESIKRLFNI